MSNGSKAWETPTCSDSRTTRMRLILDPIRMAQLSLTPTDIANVVREQNRDFPAGTIGREPAPKGTELTIPVITLGRLTDVKDFEEMIVRALPNGSMVRLKDVARVELGSAVLHTRRSMERQAQCISLNIPVSWSQCAR